MKPPCSSNRKQRSKSPSQEIAQSAPCLRQRLDRCAVVLDQHRVRHAVRERAVRLVVHLDELERQERLELVDDQPRAAVAGVHDDLERLQLRAIDVRQQVLDVLGHDVHGEALTDARGRRELARLCDPADVLQAVVAADRPRALAHELHAVVVRRVVARRDHDAAVHFARERREVHDLGAAEADVVDVHARIEQPLLEGLAELLARQADVAPDDHLLRLDELRVRAADAIGDVLVQLGRDAPAQVIGLETADADGVHDVDP